MRKMFAFDPPVPPDYFFGRSDIVKGVEHRLTHPEFLSSSIVGGPKFGCTSILRYIGRAPIRRASDGFSVLHVYFDAGLLGQSAETCDFWKGILRSMRAHPEMAPFGNSLNAAIDKASVGTLDEFDLQDLLDPIKVAKKRVAVLVDNFDSVLRADLFWIKNDFFHQIRTLSQRQSLAFVVTSPRPLLDYRRSDRNPSPFFNIFENYKIKHLTKDDICNYVKARLAEAEIEEDGSVTATVVTASLGHPLVANFVLLLCFEAKLQGTVIDLGTIHVKLGDVDGPIGSLSHRIRDVLRPSERHLLDQLLDDKPLHRAEREQLKDLWAFGLLPPGVVP